MELNTTRRLAGLRDKIPDISKTLETVRFLLGRSKGGGDDGDEGEKEEEEVDATFELNDTLFAKAKVPVMTNEVYLWLGANVMLAYPLEEAEELLKGKLLGAKGSAENCEEDLEFLREQITTLEVATARVYNWDVTEKRKEKAAGAGAGAEDEGQKS
ncbi:MAG: peptide chain release factor 1 [Cirrosporium novae-zelandiae]|nr:MAG: peptide chain release factor 1 [Cirrosporium novae-zelandiae]